MDDSRCERPGVGPILDTTRLRLRPLLPADAGRVAEILNHPEVGWMIRQIPLPYPREAARNWLEGYAAERAMGRAYRFGVISDHRLIGCADVDHIDTGEGEIGYWFDPAHWGQGFAQEAVTAVLQFAFTGLGLTSLTATHAVDNERSERLLGKLGFSKTGDLQVWSRARQQPVVQVACRLTRVDWETGRPVHRRDPDGDHIDTCADGQNGGGCA